MFKRRRVKMSDDAVLSKIRKLLALAKSPNEHEAALALSKAQEFLDKANLSASEVGEGNLPDDINSHELCSKGRFTYWESFLYRTVAKAFDCRSFLSKEVRKRSFWVVGYPQDVEVVKQLCGFLKTTISVLCDAQIIRESAIQKDWNRKSAFKFRNSFSVGASTRVCERVEESRRSRLSKDVACRALVLSRDKKVDKWVSDNLLLKKTRKTADLSERGFLEGYAAGNSISIFKEVQK